MKNFLVLSALIISYNVFANVVIKRSPASAHGASEVEIVEDYSSIRLTGDSAKALFDTLLVPAKNHLDEAGANIFFKTGKSYQCWADVTAPNGDYACAIMIGDPGKGTIRNLK